MSVWKTASAITAVLLAGCVGSPTGSTDALATSWSRYQTFGFSEDRPPSRGQTIARAEVTRQLMARGLTPSANPDLLVDVHVFATPSAQAPEMRRGTHADINSATAGHLTVRLMDTQQKSTVWQGQAQQPVTRDSLDNPQRALDRAVNDAFRNFPVRKQ